MIDIKPIVLKRDKGCIINNGCKGKLHFHHVYGLYGNMRAGVPLVNLLWRDIEEQTVILCNKHHSQLHNTNRGWLKRECRLHLMALYPDYYSQFHDLGGII